MTDGIVDTEYENTHGYIIVLGIYGRTKLWMLYHAQDFSDEFSHEKCRSSECTWVESQREGIISDQNF
jgi:hypothetical protein